MVLLHSSARSFLLNGYIPPNIFLITANTPTTPLIILIQDIL